MPTKLIVNKHRIGAKKVRHQQQMGANLEINSERQPIWGEDEISEYQQMDANKTNSKQHQIGEKTN